MFPFWPKLCDLIASLNRSFAVPDAKSAKGYIFIPGLTRQISNTILHKIQDWYIPQMRESTVNQLSMPYYTIKQFKVFIHNNTILVFKFVNFLY